VSALVHQNLGTRSWEGGREVTNHSMNDTAATLLPHHSLGFSLPAFRRVIITVETRSERWSLGERADLATFLASCVLTF
jgi:hypothetical protein